MRPPICCICGSRLSDLESGLVQFQKSASDQAWHDRMKEQNLVGHPPDLEWFCSEHVTLAEEYTSLTRPEALKKIRELI